MSIIRDVKVEAEICIYDLLCHIFMKTTRRINRTLTTYIIPNHRIT